MFWPRLPATLAMGTLTLCMTFGLPLRARTHVALLAARAAMFVAGFFLPIWPRMSPTPGLGLLCTLAIIAAAMVLLLALDARAWARWRAANARAVDKARKHA
jgi:hypothetical protein